MARKRLLSLDIARIVAILGVLMIHSAMKFVTGPNKGEANVFLTGNFFDSISRFSVPLFTMISGALMLNEESKTGNRVPVRNIKSVASLLIAWSAIYAVLYKVIEPYCSGKTVSPVTVRKAFLLGHFHLWYLYMIIGLYLLTPILKSFVKKDNPFLVRYFIIISLIFQFMKPIVTAAAKLYAPLETINQFTGKFQENFFLGYTAYFLAGWYIMHVGIKSKRMRGFLYFAGLVSFAASFTFVQYTKIHAPAYNYLNLLVFVQAVAVFCLIINLFKDRQNKSRFIASLSNLSFGVYAVHIIVLDCFKKYIPYTERPLLYIIVCYLTVSTVSYLLCFIFSKIPVLKKLVRG